MFGYMLVKSIQMTVIHLSLNRSKYPILSAGYLRLHWLTDVTKGERPFPGWRSVFSDASYFSKWIFNEFRINSGQVSKDYLKAEKPYYEQVH
jgi:hypothetical protein